MSHFQLEGHHMGIIRKLVQSTKETWGAAGTIGDSEASARRLVREAENLCLTGEKYPSAAKLRAARARQADNG